MSMLAPSPTEPFYSQQLVDTQESHQLRVIRSEALLVLLACLLAFLGFFGAFRRCCTNCIFGLFGFAAYTISSTAVAYTLDLIQNAIADSYTAHSLEDIKQWKSFNIEMAGKLFMIGWLLGPYVPTSSPMWIPIYLILTLFLNVDDRIRALMSASKDVMRQNYIFLADYMKTEHQSSDPNQVDPSCLRGYKYFVKEAKETKAHFRFPLAFVTPWTKGEAPEYRISLGMTDDVITIEKVWNCRGRLLSASGGDPDGQLKDLCLSFSLFNLTRLRFAGYSLPREAHDKLWFLIHHSLPSEDNGYRRVFRVIEVELALLFDLFYTNFSVTLSPRHIVLEVLQPVSVLAFSLAIISSYQESQNEGTRSTADALIKNFMMSTVLAVTIWCQRNRCVEKLIEIMCGIKLRQPWGRQLRQYSLLEKCSYRPPKLIYNKITAAYFDQKRDGQQEIAPTKLSEEVMKAIARSLMNNGTRNLENGRTSLRRNNVFDQLSWACDLESTTHAIMVWHIATTTVLSKYLAYLVAFAPELLPDHPCRSEFIFYRGVEEARALLEGSSILMDERIQKLKVLDDKMYGQTIVGREMMLYVTPSNDAWAHAKHLSTGGEFVTHVWVLLSHAGIARGPHGSEQHDDPERC
ncbi:hypothetical protein BT93_D0378 [Corymbia citriodora subsp. variegata]|nr:hypothetical protein BT93_D0378 [Corymbia citriodora subsp. variegata]